ncbi:MAG: hypothetical protein U5L45_10495 [Saprospiraceae bacterium]|nr:hypothetical protein [Saprospiraceae bacterium]
MLASFAKGEKLVCFSGKARKTNHPLLSLCERSEYKEKLILRKNLITRIAG